MLARVNRIRRPTRADGVFNFLTRVYIVVAADEFKPIYDFDRVKHFPDVVSYRSFVRSCENTELLDLIKLSLNFLKITLPSLFC